MIEKITSRPEVLFSLGAALVLTGFFIVIPHIITFIGMTILWTVFIIQYNMNVEAS